ncbi:MAG: hypothetical protein IJM74_07930 [Bacteroidales bacterium]|nr:hypothetical protein [Bacteroidales bacterium]
MKVGNWLPTVVNSRLFYSERVRWLVSWFDAAAIGGAGDVVCWRGDVVAANGGGFGARVVVVVEG